MVQQRSSATPHFSFLEPAVSSRVYRIGIDARFYRKSTAGLGRYTRELLRYLALADRHNDYTVFLTPADFAEWEPLPDNFTPVVVDIPHYSPAEQTRFARLLNGYRFDLVHFLNFNHPLLYRRPFITTLHDVTMLLYPETTSQGKRSWLRRLLFLWVFRDSMRRARKVIAISENTAADAQKYFRIPHAKMEVIYHGRPVPEKVPFGAKAAIQEYLGTRDPYILFLSQWRTHKGILTLLEAFALLKEQAKLPHKLVLLGRQEAASAEIRAALAASPVSSDIITPGFAPDDLLPALLSYASVFAVPSEYEGFGLPVLEALTYGAPTVVAENSSLPEVGGDAVLYFPTSDASALAHQLLRLISEPELVEKLRAKIPKQLKKFTWEHMAEQTLGVYQTVLEKQR